MRKFAFAVVTTAALAAMSAPVHAVPPDETSGAFTDSIPLQDACGFPLEMATDGTFVHRHYRDQDGNVVRHQTWLRGTDTVTNPQTGESLTGKFAYSDSQTQDGDESGPIAFNGLSFHLTVPGAGTVVIDAGRIVLDVESGELTMSGNHQVLEGDLDAFCEALAP